MQQKIEKNFFVSYVIAVELVAVNSSYYEEDNCHRQLVH